MPLLARVGGFDFPVSNFSASWTINEVNEFSFTLQLVDFQATGMSDAYLQDASLQFHGEELVTGFVYDDGDREIDQQGIVMVNFHCYGEIGRLICKRKKTDAHYQNQPLVFILTDLLNLGTTDWELGDASTMPDPLVATTIDLRNKETRFAQVIEAVKSVPELFARYGGYNTGTGRHQVDIGQFGTLYTPGLLQGDNLVSEIRRNKSTHRRYKVIHGTGGKAGDTVITLEHASLYDPSLLTHPDYPISNVGGDWIVTNNLIGLGCEISKSFSGIKTANDTVPTAIETYEAGYALWQRCVRYFEENQDSVSLSANGVLPSTPLPGDNIRVKGDVWETFYDALSETFERFSTFDVDDEYRITNVSLSIGDDVAFDSQSESVDHRLTYAFELSDSMYPEDYDDELLLYEKVERFDQQDSSAALVPINIVVDSDTQGPGVPSNCTQTFPVYNGRTFSVPLPVPPAGVTQVSVTTSIDPAGGADIEITQYPALPATGLQACVSYNGNWTVVNSGTLTVIFIFT
jgi:hypothetical protein